MLNILNDKNFYYKEISEHIANSIVSLMSEGHDMMLDYILWEYEDIEIIDEDYEKPLIKWVFNIGRVPAGTFDSSGRDYDITASAGYDECGELSVYINFLVKKGMWIKKLKIDYPELVGVIAHEIHHITQNEKDILTAGYDGDDDNADVQYFLDPSEIEAFHVGFRAQCALSGEDMREAMLSYLKYRELSHDQVENIINEWLNVEFA